MSQMFYLLSFALNLQDLDFQLKCMFFSVHFPGDYDYGQTDIFYRQENPEKILLDPCSAVRATRVYFSTLSPQDATLDVAHEPRGARISLRLMTKCSEMLSFARMPPHLSLLLPQTTIKRQLKGLQSVSSREKSTWLTAANIRNEWTRHNTGKKILIFLGFPTTHPYYCG